MSRGRPDVRPDIVLTCCRNEEDVVGVFVQHYLAAGFDAVHVVDNGSTDRTADRVAALARQGLPVTLQSDPRDGYERYLTEWFQAAGARYQPRWVFFLDCDEFILFPGPAKDYLERLPPAVNRLRLRQKEMYPALTPDPRPGGFLLSRRAEPVFNDTTKDVVRWHPEATVRGGKHRIDVPGAVTHLARDIFIRHYKYRAPEQSRQKEVNRVAVHNLYTDEDLTRITAFSLEAARAWVAHVTVALAQERWRESFAPDRPAMDDPLMADHALTVFPELR